MYLQRERIVEIHVTSFAFWMWILSTSEAILAPIPLGQTYQLDWRSRIFDVKGTYIKANENTAIT